MVRSNADLSAPEMLQPAVTAIIADARHFHRDAARRESCSGRLNCELVLSVSFIVRRKFSDIISSSISSSIAGVLFSFLRLF